MRHGTNCVNKLGGFSLEVVRHLILCGSILTFEISCHIVVPI